MILGFTGTQAGMTARQAQAFVELIHRLEPEFFHHGDCIGADAQAHALVRLHTLPALCAIVIHPPDVRTKRAFCKGDRVVLERPYLKRNRDIVLACDELVAAPKTMNEELRSGTWATVRMARKRGKRVHMLWPNGQTEELYQ